MRNNTNPIELRKIVRVNVADIWSERVMTLSREILSADKTIVTTNGKKSEDVVVVVKKLL